MTLYYPYGSYQIRRYPNGYVDTVSWEFYGWEHRN